MPYLVDCVNAKTSIITVEGGVDATLHSLVDEILLKDKTPHILLDLESSRPLLGDHIEYAVELHHKCVKQQGSFRLCHLHRETQYVMEIMNLDEFFYIYPTVQEALADLEEFEETGVGEETLEPEESSLRDEQSSQTEEKAFPSDPEAFLFEEEIPLEGEALETALQGALQETPLSETLPKTLAETLREEVELGPPPEERKGGNELQSHLPKVLSPSSLPKVLGKSFAKERLKRRTLSKTVDQLSLLEREERVQHFVHYVAKSMVHLKVFEYLVKHPESRVFTLSSLGSRIEEPEEEILEVIQHLDKLRIINSSDKKTYKYAPGPRAVHDIQDFLRMWNHPKNHAKILTWVLAEEKIYKESRKKGNEEKENPIAWKKWFSKENSAVKRESSLLDSEEDEEKEVDDILEKAMLSTKKEESEEDAGELLTLDLGGDEETPLEEINRDLVNQRIDRIPENLKKLQDRARLYRHLKQLDKAINDYNSIIDLRPQNLKARYARAELYDLQEKQRLSIQDYTYIIQSEPTNYAAIRNRSEAFYRSLNYDRSVKDCNTLLKAAVFQFDAYSTRGKCYQNVGKWPQAINDFTQALRLKPHWAKGLLYRGKAYKQIKKYTEALKDFEASKKLNPSYLEINKLIAEVQQKR
jgi:tetratricopeptide (TPR) repeat protein